MTEMICPKCHGAMRSYERNGINIEQCSDCRGIFLDKGELEHLIAGEARWQAAPPAPATYTPHQQSYSGTSKPYYKRKKSFFEELFD